MSGEYPIALAKIYNIRDMVILFYISLFGLIPENPADFQVDIPLYMWPANPYRTDVASSSGEQVSVTSFFTRHNPRIK